jgi:hypothetical protein
MNNAQSSKLLDLYLNGNGSFQRMLQFEVLVLIAIVIIVATFFFSTTYAFVIILLTFTYFVANSYVEIKTNTVSDFNRNTMNKLNTLQNINNKYVQAHLNLISNSKLTLTPAQIEQVYQRAQLDSMYYDAQLIHFIYSIKTLAEYNAPLFSALLKTTNNILKIRKQVAEFYQANGSYPDNIAQMLQVAMQLRVNAINTLHDFIYTTPKLSVMNQYVNNIVDRYNLLISRNLDTIHQAYLDSIQQTGINATTQFVSYAITKPFEAATNPPLHPNKIGSQLYSNYY